MTFSYTKSEEQGITVFKLEGEIIDKAQTAEFVGLIDKLSAEGQNRFILELSGLRYMNSSGLNVLVHILTKARNSGGEVVVCNLSKKVNDLLVITKLDTIFHILPSVADGVKKLKSK